MAKIIISYRRSDSDVFAGRVHDRIVSRYGDQSAFIDVDNIPLGKDFRVHIQEELANADAILVIVGPKWLGSAKGGHSRIMDATDPVRIEVETALGKGVPTIPILVGNTTMPRPEQLPQTLKDFPFLNAAPVDTSRDFHRDLNRVIATIDKILHVPPDKSDERERANDKQRAAEAKAQTAAEIARQTERDRIASEAEAARRRDDEERRQKAEAEVRQREAERQADDLRQRESDAEAKRLAQEHLQREKEAEQIQPVIRGEETDTRQRTTALQHFLGSTLLINSGFCLIFIAIIATNLISYNPGHLYLVPFVWVAFLLIFILAAFGAGIGTIRGKRWARIGGCSACLIGALLAAVVVFANESESARPIVYFGLTFTISAVVIAAVLVASAVLFILGWRSDSRFARDTPENLTIFGAFLLATAVLPFGLLGGVVSRVRYLDVPDILWFGPAIFVTGAISICCLMDFRRKFTATGRKSA